MKSEYFFCPHCRSKLQKSAAAFVMGEVKYGIALGERTPTVTCPACGKAIDSKAMIEGKYDNTGGWTEILGCFAWIGGTGYLMIAHELGFWTALGISTGVLIVLGLAEHAWSRKSARP